MRVWLACAGAAAWIAATPPALAAADPAEKLVRAADAARTATYEGVVLYRGDERFDVLRVQHTFRADGERERMDSLTGEPRQLLRIGDRLICVLPKNRSLSVDRPALKGVLESLTAERVKGLNRWYEFRDLGTTRVAGRPCDGVGVVPRDEFRYGYEVWIDQASHVPLKLSLLGTRGETLEQIMYTEVSYPESIPVATFETEVDTTQFNLVTGTVPNLYAADAPGMPQVTFERLPPGYRVVAREQHELPGDGDGHVEHLLLTDGLSAVSVFSAIEQGVEASPSPGFNGVSHMGPVRAYGRRVGRFHITIVGEAPSAAVRMIGDFVRPVFLAEEPDGVSTPAAPR